MTNRYFSILWRIVAIYDLFLAWTNYRSGNMFDVWFYLVFAAFNFGLASFTLRNAIRSAHHRHNIELATQITTCRLDKITLTMSNPPLQVAKSLGIRKQP